MNKRNYLNTEKKVVSYIRTKLKFKFKFHIYITFLLVLFFFSIFSSKKILKLRILNLSSEITLIMKGKGDKYIFTFEGEEKYTYLDSLPDEIYVNGIPQNEKGKIAYNLTEKENNITLIWNSSLTNCRNMFRSLNSIIKVDLSKFDSSQVTNMYCMFFGCENLISIDLSNLNTSIES